MPRKYKRKEGAVPHGQWSQAALVAALKAVEEGQLGRNEISRKYGIPARTLIRRFKNQNARKMTLGKHPVLDFDNENRLVAEIQRLEKEGITPTRDMIRKLAFEFAENLGLNVPFNKKTRMAGVSWLASFLERHPEVKVQKHSPSGSQELDMKVIVDTAKNLMKDAETSLDLPSQVDETVSEDSHDSDYDPLVIKTERVHDEFDDEPLVNAVPVEESEVLLEFSGCSSKKGVVKENEPSIDESKGKNRSDLVEVKCDGVDLLFLGYAAAVKKLSRRKQIVLKQEISRIIAEAELSELEMNAE